MKGIHKMSEVRMQITKTGEDNYHIFANENFIHIEEDVDGPKLMGMTGLTTQEMFDLFDLNPVGHKETITRR
jgi:hypothetical protein